MLKWLVLFCLVQAIVAIPGMRTQEEIQEFRDFLYRTKQDRDITLEEAMAQNPQASAWENSGKYQGDIELLDEEIDELVNDFSANVTDDSCGASRNGLIDTRRRWPGNTIAYEIAPGFFNNNEANAIHNAANWFGQQSCVRWVRRTNQREFVRITGRPTGCYANVGFHTNHIHTLNLAPRGCMNRYIIIHEMLHIAGFMHMHQTYNRYDFISINFANVIRGQEHNFNIFRNNVVTMFWLPYEYGSNQHYGETAFSSNGRPTIVARFNHGGQMGRLQVTRYDILRLRRMYNCAGAWNVEISADDLNKPYDDEFAQRLKIAADKEIAERTINYVPLAEN